MATNVIRRSMADLSYFNVVTPLSVGVESDNLVTQLIFSGVPAIGGAQLVTLHWSLDDGTAGDIAELTQTADGYAWDVGNTITQYGGKPISAYLRVTAGELTWSTQSFRVTVHGLPDIADAVPITPTLIDQMLAAIAQHPDADACEMRLRHDGGLSDQRGRPVGMAGVPQGSSGHSGAGGIPARDQLAGETGINKIDSAEGAYFVPGMAGR